MSRRGLQLALAGALICIAAPSVAFDSISQPSQGVTFYLSVPFDAPSGKKHSFSQSFAAGVMVKGKREYETFNLDSRMFGKLDFFGTGIEAKWIIAGVVAAGAAVAIASKSKSTSQQYEQQQQQQALTQAEAQAQTQAQQQSQTNGGGGTGGTGTGGTGTFHPDGTPHVDGDNCACHQ
jgi:hypothetical protein